MPIRYATLVSVSVTNGGFTLDGTTVTWEFVRAIATYKHDLLVYDEVCLAFKLSDNSWVHVSEEVPGFQSLVEEVESRYPAVPRDWFREVMFSAFAKNYRFLWGVA